MVVEDYLHGANRFAAILLLNLAAFAGAAFGLFCLVRIEIGIAAQAAQEAATAGAMQAIQGMLQGGGMPQ